MRNHFSTAVTVFVASLFVLGTTGCRSNGGPWYNPTSYTWIKPSDKGSQAPPFAPEAFANPKPALEAQPNIESPMGGYSDGASLYSNRSVAQSGVQNSYPLDQGGYHSPVASNSYGGGYSVAEPSPYPPPYASGQPSAMASPQQYQYPAEMAQQANPMPYGSDYSAGAQYPHTNVVSPYPTAASSQAAPNYGTSVSDPYGNANPAMGGNYAPFGAVPQNDPYAATQQQAPAPYGTPSPYANEGVPVATPYQPYQPSPSGGYNY